MHNFKRLDEVPTTSPSILHEDLITDQSTETEGPS